MILQWSNYVLDKFVAPELSKLTAPSLVAVPVDDDLISINMATSLLVVQWPEQARVFNSILIRRTILASKRYNDFIEAIESYVSGRNNGQSSLRVFNGSLEHLEQSLIQAQIAIRTMIGISSYFQVPAPFATNDGSIPDRITKIANRIKHFDEDVLQANGTDYCTPVWVTDSEICARTTKVTFTEYQEVLSDLFENCKYVAITAPQQHASNSSSQTPP